MSLSRAEVEKVSLLARLKLSETELDTMTAQLTAIIDYVEQLRGLDTASIQPMAHAMELQNVFSDDTARDSLTREAALGNAPHQDGECYRVPAVLG